MNEDASPPPALEPVKKPDATWLRALGIMRRNPRETLFPIAVTQLPFAVITAVVFYYLFNSRYPEADFKNLNSLAEGPQGVRFVVLILSAAQMLFAMVGAAATVVAVDALQSGKRKRLVDALDPAFLRMGSLLALGTIYFALLAGTLIGVIVLIYLLIRCGLALHAIALEGRTVGQALRQSWTLMRGRMLRFIGLMLTVPAMAVAVLVAGSIVLVIATLPFGTEPTRHEDLIAFCLGTVIGGMLAVPLYSYLATTTTLFYLSAKESTR